MKTVRVFFQKTGSAKYISHLDIVRCFSRAIARAKLPVWYTEGYNPKVHMAFYLPIPLGFEGLAESFEIRMLDDDYSHELICQKLNDVLPQSLRITRVLLPSAKADQIATAEYKTELAKSSAIDAESFNKFFEQDEILVSKKTKKGIKEIDLRPHFSIVSTTEDNQTLIVKLLVAAGTSLNINPTLIYSAFFKFCRVNEQPYNTTRVRILDVNGNEWQ